MHRIDTTTAQKDKWGAGKNGWTEGDPSAGVRATSFNASFCDAIQEEICNAIEKSGIALDPNDNTQLYQVLSAIIKDIGKYLAIANNLSEIAAAGQNAQKSARENLALGTAAVKDAGTATGQVIPVGGFGIGLEESENIGIDFTTYIFRAGEVIKLSINDCSNVPTEIASEENVYVQCFGVRNTDYGCGVLISVYENPGKTFIAHREDNFSGNWVLIQLSAESDLSNYLPLTGGTLSGDLHMDKGHAIYSLSPILVEVDNPGTVDNGSFVTTPVRKFRLKGRGAFEDPEGAFAQVYYEEHVGVDNAICIEVNGFGCKSVFRVKNGGSGNPSSSSLDLPGSLTTGAMVIEAGQRVYSPNNPPPAITGDNPGATAMLYDSTAPHNFGDRVNGSALYPAGADGAHATVPVSGTWVCQGQTDTTNEAHRTTIWTRLV